MNIEMAIQYYSFAASLGHEEAKNKLNKLRPPNSHETEKLTSISNDKPHEVSTETLSKLKKLEFQEIRIPFGYQEKQIPFCPIYASKNAAKSKKLVLFIQGSGKDVGYVFSFVNSLELEILHQEKMVQLLILPSNYWIKDMVY